MNPFSKAHWKDETIQGNLTVTAPINLTTCHKAKTSWNTHITEMFYILYMMSSQKAIVFVSKIVINSCSGVLASSVLSLVSPTTTDKAKCCFYLTTILREKSPSMQLSQQFLCYLCSRSCSCFAFLWATQVTISTHSQPTMQQVSRAHPKCFIQGSHPMGGQGTLLS